MFATMRRHHHPIDDWEPDDADEVAEELTLEDIRHCAAWDPWSTVADELPALSPAPGRHPLDHRAAARPSELARA
jgi:hypothetical protein